MQVSTPPAAEPSEVIRVVMFDMLRTILLKCITDAPRPLRTPTEMAESAVAEGKALAVVSAAPSAAAGEAPLVLFIKEIAAVVQHGLVDGFATIVQISCQVRCAQRWP